MPLVAGAGRLHQQAALGRVAVVDPKHKVPFAASVSDFYPQAFYLLTAVLQRQLLAPSLSPDVEGSTSPSPFSPLPSELGVAIESRTPARGFISPGFSKGNQAIAS